jgi:hypothetical protein
MHRRRLLISVGLVLGFVGLVLAGLVAAVKREPSFYTQATMPEGLLREENSRQTTGEFLQLRSSLQRDEPGWKLSLTGQQLNAYFQQDYYEHGGDNNLPDGFSAPRVKFEDGRMRLGVRCGRGWLSTILSIEIKAWLVPGQTNMMAMEIVSLKAGALPLSPGTLVDDISEAVRRENIDITWYRTDGHPVAVMRFQSDLTRPTMQFDRLDLKDDSMTIAGRSVDFVTAPAAPAPPVTMGPPPRVVSGP